MSIPDRPRGSPLPDYDLGAVLGSGGRETSSVHVVILVTPGGGIAGND